MRERIRQIRSNDKGVTLIELLIIVVILGVLAGIVVFAVGAFTSDGVKAACKADMKTVEVASEAFYAKAKPHAWAADMPALVTARYLREVPSTDSYIIGYNATTGAVTGNIGTATGASCLA
jgi:general secretion pathway protein G